jgi:glycosyltransferase involved in cell wall biosynthesis
MPTMSEFDRPLADSLIRPLARTPVLSVVIPTFQRPDEMILAVTSVANQIDETLADKVEIIISDNASGPDSHAILKQLAETHPSINYYVHAENEGGLFQIYAAPHRARGRWTWVFGDDDALGEGGLRAIVEVLEREEPGFLTVNRQVWNKTLDQQIAGAKHDLPDQRFDTFVDLLGLFGFDQLSFLTSQIYATDAARAVETPAYLDSKCRYSQLAYYLEAFHDLPSYYLAAPVVWHRWDQGATDVHAANFHHLATLTPELVQRAADRVGIAPGLFEKIGGRRSILGPETRRITFVDNILENLWRSSATSAAIPAAEWDMLAGLCEQWAPQRAEQLATVREFYETVDLAFYQYRTLVAEHRAKMAKGRGFTPAEVDDLRRIEAAVSSLKDSINAARRTAMELSAPYR